MGIRKNQDDQFEELLRAEVEDHKMYPSEMVWENIRTYLHGNKSWPALSVFSVLIITALSFFTFYNYPPKNLVDKKIISNTATPTLEDNEITANKISRSAEAYVAQINPVNITEQTIDALFVPIIKNELLYIEPENVTIAVQNFSPKANISFEKKLTSTGIVQDVIESNNSVSSVITNTDTHTSEVAEEKKHAGSKFNGLNFSGTDKDEDPNALSHEDMAGNKKAKSAGNKWMWQLYATPSVSYRELEDESSPIISNLNGNIDKTVNHKPAMGIEFGGVLKYSILKNLRITSGLQFNIRQYYIDAYRSSGLATFSFINNNHLDSISIFSIFANSGAGSAPYLSTKLDNKLYQISIPIGIEWDMIQGKKWGTRIAAAIQPTFTLNKSIYAISSDYKYYADGTPFFRKWNYNTNIEFNLTYKTAGNTIWFIGPQIRYQHLPTYNDVYSIKEHRIDYGLKIGFSKPLN